MRYKYGVRQNKYYYAWSMMKQRCENPKNIGYKNYGGRGIKLCDEWRNSFQDYFDYVSALPHFGEPGRTLDRINNDGNYEPGNVRWATRTEQSRNQRSNIKLIYNGEVHTALEISALTGISVNTIYGVHRTKGVIDFTSFKPKRAEHWNIAYIQSRSRYVVYSCGKNLGEFKTLEAAITFRDNTITRRR